MSANHIYLIQFANDGEWARYIFGKVMISLIIIALIYVVISNFRQLKKMVAQAKRMTVKERGIFLYKELRKLFAEDDDEFEEIEEEAERLASEDANVEQKHYVPESAEQGPAFVQKTIRSSKEFMTFCWNSIKREDTIYLLDNTDNLIVKVKDIISLDGEPISILLEDGSFRPYEDCRYSKA